MISDPEVMAQSPGVSTDTSKRTKTEPYPE